MWKHRGGQRPDFAQTPGPGQESVWDYPRPPALERSDRVVRVEASGVVIAETDSALILKETASPPTYYLPNGDIDRSRLVPVEGQSMCEWKGLARYFALAAAPDIVIAWGYPQSREPYAALRDCLSFYPGRIECYVDDERVRPQPGRFYGGWITSDLVGPFKGEPGTGHW